MNSTEPVHPGDVLRLFLKRNNIAQETLAAAMCASRASINQVIRRKKNITALTAFRIGFVTQTDPMYWLNMQMAWSLWDMEQRSFGLIKRMTVLKNLEKSNA